jgi:hypothetical protein
LVSHRFPHCRFGLGFFAAEPTDIIVISSETYRRRAARTTDEQLRRTIATADALRSDALPAMEALLAQPNVNA